MVLPADIERGVWRGKAKLDRSWVYGDLHHSLEDPDVVFIFDYEASEWILVDPETLGEFTTIRDKNGTPIFEGDVLAVNGRIIGVVRHFGSGFVVMDGNGEIVCDSVLCEELEDEYGTDVSQIEVIGNIHDNPQFLRR